MLMLDWDEDLSLGVPVVDRDHRRLIDLLNRVHLAGWDDQRRKDPGRSVI